MKKLILIFIHFRLAVSSQTETIYICAKLFQEKYNV